MNKNKCTLYEGALHHIKETDLPMLLIHEKTGLPFYWLRKFKEGAINDPSVNKVQTLYEFLTGKTLEV